MILLTLFVLTGHVNAQRQCGPNEVYFPICGTSCEPKCSDTAFTPCVQVCVRDVCQCAEGYKRNDDGNCVPEGQCCPANQFYTRCGTECQPSCANPRPMGCNERCIIGCQCKEGFLLDGQGNCVKPEDCPINQCGLYEVYKNCGTACEPTCENPNPICTGNCVRGCRCIDGYIRGPNGNCIRKEQCDTQTCGENQIYQRCRKICEPTCPGTTQFCLSQVLTTFLGEIGVGTSNQLASLLEGTSLCMPGCQCKDGYVRDSNGICINPNRCPAQTDCPRYEVYKTCGTACEPTCAEPTRVCTQQCVQGCQCIDGYVRDNTGNCVKQEQCSTATACRLSNEVYKTCGTACEPTCRNPNPICTANCVRGCRCIEGYIRGPDGNCIRKDQCDTQTCGDNQIYQRCRNTCEPSCKGMPQFCPVKIFSIFFSQDEGGTSNQISSILEGTGLCVPGCQCIDGYVRDSNDNCIRPNSCPVQQCPQYQVYKGCGSACEPTCAEPNRICSRRCVPGCQCMEGYVRDSSQNCVKPDRCSTSTACRLPNEVYKTCGTACEPTCRNPNPVCTDNCVRGCRCIDGYIRGPDGDCIRKDQCGEQTCGNNQIYQRCRNTCEPSCKGMPQFCPAKIFSTFFGQNTGSTLGQLSSLLESASLCVPGCQCKDGYVRDSNDNCINPNSCPVQQCPRYQVYKACGTACEPTCAEPNRVCRQRCVPGCQCIEGYVKDNTGNCVKPEQCSTATACRLPNEVYKTCGTACEPSCANPNPICTANCVRGCRCIEGYIRGPDGNCIRKDQCDTQTCGDNQIHQRCRNTCEPSCKGMPQFCPAKIFSTFFGQNTGSTLGQLSSLLESASLCVPGCQCKDGYVRDSNNNCIRPNSCPVQQCPRFQVYRTCGTACEPTCAEPNRVCRQRCVPGCQCIEGYVRDEIGNCVKPDQCPTSTACRLPNEVYKTCGTACEPTCRNPNPVCTDNCVRGCRCIDGYIRGPDGNCIRKDQCDTQICGENQIFQRCRNTCEPSCKGIPPFCLNGLLTTFFGQDSGSTLGQLSTLLEGTSLCVPGCQCKDGFVRDSNDNCINPNSCPVQQCPRYQVYKACGTACEPTCAEPSRVCRPRCVPGCQCIDGYIRDNAGNCVRPDQCSSTATCRLPNEVYKTCGTACEPSCRNPNPTRCTKQCVRGCQCTDGYYRDDRGMCVKLSECQKDPNPPCSETEIFMECGTPCEPTCEDQQKQPCPGCARGCRCKAGFFRNSLGACVASGDCQRNICPINQIYKDCGTGGTACEPSCDNPSPDVCTDNCVAGCECKYGFLRNRRGDCVRPSQCNDKVCRINEFYTECGTACPHTCARPEPGPCPDVCVPGCQCVNGFVRNDAGICVREDECPQRCAANEVYKDCGTACEPSCAEPRPLTCTEQCVKGCQCQDGFLRHADGRCVKPDQCSSVSTTCGNHEIYKPCGKSCETHCNDKTPSTCTGPCVAGCACIDGYVRHENGACVLPFMCDKEMKCEDNEEFLECGTCEKTCAEPEPQNCPAGCYMGCQCKDGFLRDYNGDCIEADECEKTAEEEPPQPGGILGALDSVVKLVSKLFGLSSFNRFGGFQPQLLGNLKPQRGTGASNSFKPLSPLKPLLGPLAPIHKLPVPSVPGLNT